MIILFSSFKEKHELYHFCENNDFVFEWINRGLDTFVLYTGNDHKEEDMETPLHRVIREDYDTSYFLYIKEKNKQHKDYALIWASIYNNCPMRFITKRKDEKDKLPLIKIESIMSKRYLSKVEIVKYNIEILKSFSNYYEFINLNKDFIMTHCKEMKEDDFEIV